MKENKHRNNKITIANNNANATSPFIEKNERKRK
jgi:hypothetical protein